MHVGTCSMLVLCTEHQLTCNCQTVNNTVGVLTFSHLMYLNTRNKRGGGAQPTPQAALPIKLRLAQKAENLRF